MASLYVDGLEKLTGTDIVMDAVKKVGKIDPEFKRKWIEALKSGNYKQGAGMLYMPKSQEYCCLGVGCEVSGYKSVDIEDKQMPYELFITKEEADESPLPPLFKCENDTANSRDSMIILNFLAAVNDNGHYTFDEIATWIDENL